MQSVTQDGITIEFPDDISPGSTQITWKAEANTGRAKTVTFYIVSSKGEVEEIEFNVGGS